MLQWNYGGPEVDIWALGCILYKLIFGTVPFQDFNENLTFNKILNSELEFPKEDMM